MANQFELHPPPYKDPAFSQHWRNWLNLVYEKLRGPLWENYTTSLIVSRPGATAPTLRAFGPTGNIQQLDFAVNDFVYTAGFPIGHDIKPGSLMYPFVYWSTNGINTNTVKWELSYTYAKGHDQEAFPAETTLNLEKAGSGTAWQLMITEASDTEAFTAPEVDSSILLKLRRVTNGGTDNADQVFGLFIGMHYQKDRFGTPQKAPDFYKR